MKQLLILLFTVINLASFSQVQVATLNGSGSSDPEGRPLKYKWIQVGTTPVVCKIANDTLATTTAVPANNLQWAPGVYNFQLTVTDDQGATASAITHITVMSNPPTVDAGVTQTATLPVTSLTLKATGKATVGKVIWSWSQLSGPGTVTFSRKDTSTVAISNFLAGAYLFRVTLSDNFGASSTDTVSVIIKAANQAPAANAGNDQSITLPQNAVTIGGIDNPSNVAIRWRKISGGTAVIQSPTSAFTSITDLQAGTYVFQKTVTNASGSANDNISVTVKKKCSWFCQIFGCCK